MKEIKIKGKSYPIAVTMGAILRFKELTGHDVSQMAEDDTSEMITFLFCCMMSKCGALDVECDLTLYDFADALDVAEAAKMMRELNAGEMAASKKKKAVSKQ